MKNKLSIISLIFAILTWISSFILKSIPYLSDLGPGIILCRILGALWLFQIICVLIGILLPIKILMQGNQNESKLFAITSILISACYTPFIILGSMANSFCGG